MKRSLAKRARDLVLPKVAELAIEAVKVVDDVHRTNVAGAIAKLGELAGDKRAREAIGEAVAEGVTAAAQRAAGNALAVGAERIATDPRTAKAFQIGSRFLGKLAEAFEVAADKREGRE